MTNLSNLTTDDVQAMIQETVQTVLQATLTNLPPVNTGLTRNATVQAFDAVTRLTSVLIDNDTEGVVIPSVVEADLLPSQRVTVTFQQPHGAQVSGVASTLLVPPTAVPPLIGCALFGSVSVGPSTLTPATGLSVFIDTDGFYNSGTGVITIPTGRQGLYGLTITGNFGTVTTRTFVEFDAGFGTHYRDATGEDDNVCASTVVATGAGSSYTASLFQAGPGTPSVGVNIQVWRILPSP